MTHLPSYETYIAVAAGIPVIREGMFPMNQILEIYTDSPDQTRWDIPLVMFDMTPHDSTKYRIIRPLTKMLVVGMDEIFYFLPKI